MPFLNLNQISLEDAQYYQHILWKIYVASGADTDGDTDPGALIAGMGRKGFADAVLGAVEYLSEAYDEVLEEVFP